MEDNLAELVSLLVTLFVTASASRRLLLTIWGTGRRQRQRRNVCVATFLARKKTLRREKIKRGGKLWEVEVPTWSDKKFRANFRMSRPTFDRLVDLVADEMVPDPTSPAAAVPLRKRVAIALWTMATTSELRSVGCIFSVGTSTVHKFFKMFVRALLTNGLPAFIRLPSDEEAAAGAERVRRRTGIPAVWAAIDGTHIPISAPKGRLRDYLNRKGWTSVVAQGVVDDRGRFVSMCCQNAGSNHDAHVLRGSHFYRAAEAGQLPQGNVRVCGENVPLLVVGDAAYPLRPYLVKGFQGPTTTDQRHFNVQLNKARVVVEQAFGRLKCRWRRILKRSEHYARNVPKMVMAAAVLHNLVESSGDPFNPAWMAAVDRAHCQAPQPVGRRADRRWDTRRGRELQRLLFQHVTNSARRYAN